MTSDASVGRPQPEASTRVHAGFANSGDQSQDSIVDRFERQVTTSASGVAVQTRQRTINYSELNLAADRIASALGASEPGGRRIAILLDPDVEYLFAMLGILKTGSVYVPLDPSYPRDRIRYMIDDADVEFLLTSTRHLPLARELTGAHKLLEIESLSTAESFSPIAIPPDTVAYITYTSGSTGQPKGVLQTHRNLLHHVSNYIGGLGIGPEDRISFFYSYCFSASLMDVFGALLTGATLFPHYLKHEPIDGLAEWLRANRITVYHSIPSVFRQFVAGLDETETFPDIHAIDLAGEPLYATDLDGFRRHFPPSCLLVNHMALTECSVSAQFKVYNHTPVESKLVPVGHAAPGVVLRILDEDGHEVAAGDVGELLVESRYLSPGYWNKPELTASLFHQHPTSPAISIYHTGDLAKMDAKGCLTHFGRKDSRVKVRGYTIEVAEIETALQEHPRISAAIVLAKPNTRDQLRLVAYLVTRQPRPNVSELRRHLRARLPDFMVPSVYVVLPAFPKTPNGKVDRAALPDPGNQRPDLECGFVAPLDAVQNDLAKIWEKVLGITPVGIDDDFFDLGGDSLLATLLVGEVEKTFRVRLSLSTLVEAPSIRLLADALAGQQRKASWRPLVSIRSEGDRRSLFFVHCGHGNVFRYFDLAQHITPNYPIFGLQPAGLDGQRPFPRSVRAMAKLYLGEIRSVQPTGPYLLGGFSFGGLVAFEMAQLLRSEGESIDCLYLFDTVLFANYGISTRKARQHLANISSQSLGHGVTYFANKLNGQIRSFRDSTRAWVGRLPAELRLRLGFPLPVTRRSAFFQRLSTLAARKYTPEPYPGSVIFFEGEDDRAEVWRPYVTGDFEIFQIDCPHDHLLRDPHIRQVAARINATLASIE